MALSYAFTILRFRPSDSWAIEFCTFFQFYYNEPFTSLIGLTGHEISAFDDWKAHNVKLGLQRLGDRKRQNIIDCQKERKV